MHPYATEISESHYYFKDGKLHDTYDSGRLCVLAPGDLAWKSDLSALGQILRGEESQSVESVVAKYLINEQQDGD
jgi:hypothetical protein